MEFARSKFEASATVEDFTKFKDKVQKLRK